MGWVVGISLCILCLCFVWALVSVSKEELTYNDVKTRAGVFRFHQDGRVYKMLPGGSMVPQPTAPLINFEVWSWDISPNEITFVVTNPCSEESRYRFSFILGSEANEAYWIQRPSVAIHDC